MKKYIIASVILALVNIAIWKFYGIEGVLCIGFASIIVSLGLIEEKLSK